MREIDTRMRDDWNDRAVEDFSYYISTEKKNQDLSDFKKSGKDIVKFVSRYFKWLKNKPEKVLEIGCGAGRLMRHMSSLCDEVYGYDISANSSFNFSLLTYKIGIKPISFAFSKDFSASSTKIVSLFLTPSLPKRISKISGLGF